MVHFMVVCIIMYRVALLLLGRIKKYMTKFQFHFLIALGFLIIAENAVGFRFHVYWFLVYLFTIFALFDVYKLEQEKFFNKNK